MEQIVVRKNPSCDLTTH